METELIKGEGLVLVVDDEAMIRHTAREILRTCGYSLVLAPGSSGFYSEALYLACSFQSGPHGDR
jgi:CheY-like chemotaxis protein